MAEKEFAMNHDYKLYRDGQFFDITHDEDEQRPFTLAAIAGEAAAAHKLLQAALDKFRDARPARLASEAGPAQKPAKNATE